MASRAAKCPAIYCRTRLEAASAAYQLAVTTDQTQESGTETVYRWSCRWLEAQRAIGPNKEDRITAAEAHLTRMRDLAARTQKTVQAGLKRPFDEAMARYYVSEAAVWAAEARGK